MGYDEAREAAARAAGEVMRDAFDNKARPVRDVSNAAIDAFLAKLSADSEMVERVAKAIYYARFPASPIRLRFEKLEERGWNAERVECFDLARAAIAAMLAQEVKP